MSRSSFALRERLKKALDGYPRTLNALRSIHGNIGALRREARALVRFGPRLLASRRPGALRGERWRAELPVQAPSRFDVSQHVDRLEARTVQAWCEAGSLALSAGWDSVYLPPQSWAETPLAPLQRCYPAGVGLKIAKLPGNSDAFYMDGCFGRSVPQKVSFSHRKQTLTFNFLHLREIAPRLYDLMELTDASGTVWTAYVVEHVEPSPLEPDDCQHLVEQLRSLERNRLIELISMNGWRTPDFEPPDCNGNLVRSKAHGRPVYVDIHNFILDRYEDHLLETARKATAASHFGARSFLLGGPDGGFLYQEIPGVDLPGKRSPRRRMEVLDRLLAEAGVDLLGKVVFDVGCNLGLMGAEYLRRGARWVHGWDRDEVVTAARSVLLSIGCTRFSVKGVDLVPEVDLQGSLPHHLTDLCNDDAMISYLAIRGHVGWLPALGRLPWRTMFYEGHQQDGTLREHLETLNALVPIRVLAEATLVDGMSEPRQVAVLQRTELDRTVGRA